MEPIERTFKHSKQEVMNTLPSALNAAGMSIMGRNDKLGLISFQKPDHLIIYAHIVEKSELTRVSLTPGLSYVRERNPSEMPAEVQEVLRKVDEVMNKG
ncbi:MAG TPA: hypothetical protein VF181_07505 [Balneolaceae bacterium]